MSKRRPVGETPGGARCEGQADRARAWAHAIAVLKAAGCDPKVLKFIVREAIWYVPLRIKGPRVEDFRYWSEGVAKTDGKVAFEREHSIPRAQVEARIAPLLDEGQIRDALEACVVCAVTPDEHRTLATVSDADWRLRYEKAGVRVFDRRLGRWL